MDIKIDLTKNNLLDKIRGEVIDYVLENTKTQVEASEILGVDCRTLRNYRKRKLDYKPESRGFEMRKFVEYIRKFLNGCKNVSVGSYIKRNTDDKTYNELKVHRKKLRSMVLDTNQEVRENLEDIGSIVEKVKDNVELTDIESTFCQILFVNDLIDGAGNFTQKGKHELLN
jgi:hypothetical protein